MRNIISLIKKRILIILAGIVLGLCLVYIFGVIFYRSHVLPNTFISDVSLSNCSENGAEEKLNSILDDYTLTIKGRDKTEECIQSKDVDLRYELAGFGEKLLTEQNSFSWPLHLFKSVEVHEQFEVSFNKTKLEKCIDSMEMMQKDNIIKPVNAYISEYESGKGFSIVPEVMGNEIDRDKLVEALEQSLKEIAPEMILDENDCYINPKLYSDSEKLVKRVEKYNKYVSAKLTYTFGEDVVVLDGDTIYDWLTFKKNGGVSFDDDKVKAFVDSLGSKYDTIFREHTFSTSYNKTIKLNQGDYGWWMNRPAEVNEIKKLIKKGAVENRKPVYFQEAAQYGTRDYGNTYVEINLTAQHLFVYVEGKMVLESDFVSGKNTKDRLTPEGIYGVTYKERDATLVGEDYETPVSYWMPFNGNVGMHDAIWRNKFGSQIYKGSGSHGCINLPFYVAGKIYELVQKGTPVICYYLDGTESSSITEQGDEEIAQFVVDAIDRIGSIEKSRIQALEKTFKRINQSYKELTSNQKKYVTNINKLEKAQKQFNKLKNGR